MSVFVPMMVLLLLELQAILAQLNVKNKIQKSGLNALNILLMDSGLLSVVMILKSGSMTLTMATALQVNVLLIKLQSPVLIGVCTLNTFVQSAMVMNFYSIPSLTVNKIPVVLPILLLLSGHLITASSDGLLMESSPKRHLVTTLMVLT